MTRIQRLDESVINRIAAGEVIQRPSNALKEMIENALDAGSTSIQVLCKEGGLKLLQIQDNGHGIQKEDLPLVCERFTTSKLKKYEDLRSISTFGFRGEALASISHVARVTVTTKTGDSPCAWRALYSDGCLLPAKPGASPDPKPCAGNNGTQITVEDMFFNNPIRLKAFRNSADEYNRIVDVVEKYALHNSSVAFSCKKVGAPRADVHTPGSSTASNSVQLIFGSSVSKELLELQFENRTLDFTCKGLVTNPNYNMRKLNFVLFINNRLVDHPSIKKSIEALYSLHLPKNTHPFLYLALSIKPENVDVNVHPTKREVHFLNEDAIIASLCDEMGKILANATKSRTFSTQAIVVGAKTGSPGDRSASFEEPVDAMEDVTPSDIDKNARTLTASRTTAKQTLHSVNKTGGSSGVGPQRAQPSRVPENRLVRTDATVRTLDAFVRKQEPPQRTASIHSASNERNSQHKQGGMMDTDGGDLPRAGRKWIDIRLTSILELREEVESKEHKGITEVFREHTFVGCVDNQLALVQHQVRLFMVNYVEISRELFYQVFLRLFSNLGHVLLPPTPLRELLIVALEEEERDRGSWDPTMKTKDEIAGEIVDILVERREMLEEYFSFQIDEGRNICALPLVLKGYTPVMEKLPTFLLRLGTEVNWDTEKDCFRSLVEEFSNFYALEPPELYLEDQSEGDGESSTGRDANANQSYSWTVEHVVFPAIRTFLIAPKSWSKGGEILEIANLPDLYKCFERC
ncbi:mutL-like protein 1, colon cancer, nonpolyposis type 2 [Gonapodya prolifera JEL478]|uniref:MutL-like protein 1, colon cancer, nonpolyposis type 2 n=1 Tax=Gonapodya prolifera (strain JEL478) TaxID=1344416 RepID=A0A139ATL2_GONPJ|nr:mutL-like protein 1, colon cancer, nonpolyposis type 2 [Gonapodya prolifera JEL478]|eukprot:KXS20066.1 mutL-like protein 1, colon cancer, nonpolyposis type 2 [Gonapodya prolifera JEL478]